MNKDLEKFIKQHQDIFGLNLKPKVIESFTNYYEEILKNRDLLHLIAPCSTEVFAVRHILESLTLLEVLPENSSFADVGTGAGLPSIPCLIARQDLRGFLIESSFKKTMFLRETVTKLGLESRAEIINRQFEEIKKPPVGFVTSRALDKFTKKIPPLVKWSGDSRLALFGGNSLRESLQKINLKFEEKLTPESEQRFLFIV